MKDMESFIEGFEAVLEIGGNDSGMVKYEMGSDDKLRVDRFLPVNMCYPCAYGYIPETLAQDGDPLDLLVLTRFGVFPGVRMKVRPVGVFLMSDEAGQDNKILAVPTNKVDAFYSSIVDISDVSTEVKNGISHFFEHYKDLEPCKVSKVEGWDDVSCAFILFKDSVIRYLKEVNSQEK